MKNKSQLIAGLVIFALIIVISGIIYFDHISVKKGSINIINSTYQEGRFKCIKKLCACEIIELRPNGLMIFHEGFLVGEGAFHYEIKDGFIFYTAGEMKGQALMKFEDNNTIVGPAGSVWKRMD